MSRESARTDDGRDGTDCVVCNQCGGETYRIRVQRRDGTDTEIEAVFCSVCIDSHLELDWIEQLPRVERADPERSTGT